MFTFGCRHDAIVHLWVSSPSAITLLVAMVVPLLVLDHSGCYYLSVWNHFHLKDYNILRVL